MARPGNSRTIPTDVNRVPFLAAADSTAPSLPQVLYADHTTHELLVKDSGVVAAISALAKPTAAYSIQAISEDATYKYFFFEDASANYYIMRKTLATNVFKYTKGTGGYSSVYVDSTHGPSGSPTWADYGATF